MSEQTAQLGLHVDPELQKLAAAVGKTEMLVDAVADIVAPAEPTDVAVDPALVRLARLVAAGILRTRNTPDGMIVERVPETRAAKIKRLERKRKRHLKRRSRK